MLRVYYRKIINSHRWRTLRNMKICDTPLCEVCSSNNRITPATEVHHIVPVENGINYEGMKRLAYDYKNLMSICHDCHVKQHEFLQSKSKIATKAKNKSITDNFVKNYLDAEN